VRVAARAVDVVRPPAPGVVVLAYHQVGGVGERSINLSVGQFDEQLSLVSEMASVCTLDHAVEALTTGRDVPSSVVVTFDDGSPDVVEHALPVLERHRVPALLYLATGFVDRAEPFWPGDRALSWNALRDAVATGWLQVGSHTDSHLLLDRAQPAAARLDIERSVERIETELGQPVRHFAYPKALAAAQATESFLRRRFASAALADGRANVAGHTDCWRLSRTPVQTFDSAADFASKMRGGLRLEAQLRTMANRRYAKAAR
jgi:peptidoglycan/xylan/chitin deacetylase (PgdA/CDA1 family)